MNQERHDWDLLIIGGGITGAGVFREAAKTGAKVCLVEQRDFASGTSSWSSKLVHGGLRYLASGHWRLTREAVRERERLIREAAGLVERLGFALPVYKGLPGSTRPALLRAGLWVYDRMSGRRSVRWHADPRALVPELRDAECAGAAYYEDARTDDARLTLRLIAEGVRDGGSARAYTRATRLLVEDGRVCGAELQDADGGATEVLRARVVVNAAGPWAGRLEAGMDAVTAPRLRPLRGSHLVFACARWPLTMAVSWMHPEDGRPVFAIPWEGTVVLGTTDLDHDKPPDDPRMTPSEANYLLAAARFAFPQQKLGIDDAVACYAGVRPVVAGDADSPSAESRESASWQAPGLVGITGGKLTTFRVAARQVLETAATMHARLAPSAEQRLFFDQLRTSDVVDARLQRLAGRYGRRAARQIRAQESADGPMLGRTPYSLPELLWCARFENIRHLDDLLLRRLRLGLIAERGGQDWLPRLRAALQPALGWDDARWEAECARYAEIWQRQHRPREAP